MSSYRYTGLDGSLLAQAMQLTTAPFRTSHIGHRICPIEIFSPFIAVGILGVSGCFSEIYGLGNRPSLRFHLVLSGNGIYLVSGVHFVYISCVYKQHTIFIIIHHAMLIPVHRFKLLTSVRARENSARAGSTMLARKILCSRGKYSLSRKIIFVQTNRHKSVPASARAT